MVESRNSLLVALVATAVIVTAALSWAGWKLLELQRVADSERARQNLETTAATMVAAVRGKLADAGDRLSAALANPSAAGPAVEGSIAVVVRPAATVVTGAGGPPFVPQAAGVQAPVEVFAQAETLEHGRGDWRGASASYASLRHHADVGIRAGALLRLGRFCVTAEI